MADVDVLTQLLDPKRLSELKKQAEKISLFSPEDIERTVNKGLSEAIRKADKQWAELDKEQQKKQQAARTAWEKEVESIRKIQDKAAEEQLRLEKQKGIYASETVRKAVQAAKIIAEAQADPMGATIKATKAATVFIYEAYSKAAELIINASKQALALVSEAGTKFISGASLITDKATMELMQKTGTTGSEAQAIQRAAASVGVSYEDIQAGRVTQAQMAAFEQVREHELTKLKEIGSKGTEVFTGIQQAQIGLGVLKRDLIDGIVQLVVSSEALKPVLKMINDFLPQVSAMIADWLPKLQPVIEAVASAVMEMLPFLMDAVGDLFPILTKVIMALLPTLKTVLKTLEPAIFVIVKLVELFAEVLTALAPVLEAVATVVKWVIEAVAWVFGWKGPGTTGLSGAATQSNTVVNNQSVTNYNYGGASNNGFQVGGSSRFSQTYALVN